ncbi:hypothetical protein HMPREF0294_0340 [Corynebacterium glucuronolyticum ATCC 51867]|nr:hypothetical protein HMPREF0294_0340 [Corynebacterium glucuronolyticum ATCC 51867]
MFGGVFFAARLFPSCVCREPVGPHLGVAVSLLRPIRFHLACVGNRLGRIWAWRCPFCGPSVSILRVWGTGWAAFGRRGVPFAAHPCLKPGCLHKDGPLSLRG